MKRVIWWMSSMVVLLAVSLPVVQARSLAGSEFDGEWVGRVTTPEGRDVDVRIVIHGSVGQQFFSRDGQWQAVDPDKLTLVVDRNNAVLVWLNSGGAWSESQIFSMSLKSANKLDLVWTRHVNNVKNGGDNETWNLLGTGTMRRTA